MLGYRPQDLGYKHTYFKAVAPGSFEQIGDFNPSVDAFNDQNQAIEPGFTQRYGIPVAEMNVHSWSRSPNNEVKFIVHDAMIWLYNQGAPGFTPNKTQGSPEPTEQELTDFQAVGDQRYWDYMRANLDGWSPDRPVHVNVSNKPHGPFILFNDFWKKDNYYYNDGDMTSTPPPPPTTPPSQPPSGDPPYQPQIDEIKSRLDTLESQVNQIINLLNENFDEMKAGVSSNSSQLAQHRIILDNQRNSLQTIRTNLAALYQRVAALEKK